MTFEEFAVGHVPTLVRLATALTGGDLGLAEDLAQEVMIKVHLRWTQVAALSNPEAYVRRMLINEFLSWRRKWARIVPFADVAIAQSHPDHASTVTDRDFLLTELRRLPKRQQVVLALRYYEGLNDAEIADTMGCRASTVRAYATRALATLRVRPARTSTSAAEPTPTQKGMAP